MPVVDLPIDGLKTTGGIARMGGVNRERAQYLILKLGLQPAVRAGRYRLFDKAAVQRVLDEIGKSQPKVRS